MAWAAKASRKASRFSACSERPAAARCPPKLSRCSEQASSAASRSKPGMLRPLPRPPPSPSSETTTTGRWWRSTRREATIPTTPGCQPSPARTSPGASRRSLRQLPPRRLGRRIDLALPRPPLRVGPPQLVAISSARPSSSVSISSTPASARYSRPAALIRGASRNARSPSSSRVGSHFEAAISARSPSRRARRISASPRLTSDRFSPTNGTTSATVASATSRGSWRLGNGVSGTPRERAWAHPEPPATHKRASKPPPSRTATRTGNC